MSGTLLELFRHKTWATLRLIEICEGLADEHLDATIPGTFGTVRETLLHSSPTAYLLGALAGCAVVFLHDTLAPQFEVDIADVTAVARCSTDQRGLLALDGIAPDLGDLALEIQVKSPSPEDRVEAMLAAWRERCPIYLALIKPQTIALTTAGGAAGG